MVDRTTTIAVRETSVFDERTNIVYSLGASQITRWDAITGRFLAPIILPGSLSSLALSPDGRYLVVGDSATITTAGQTQGVLHRIDLQTSAVTDIVYSTAFYEGGVTDVVVAANGTALFTTQFLGSGWTPLRTFPVSGAAPAPAILVNSVRGGSTLTASPDGRYVLILEANSSNAPFSLYDSTMGRVIASSDLYTIGLSGFNNDNGSVTNSGLISIVTYNSFVIYNNNFVVVKNFTPQQSSGTYSDAEFSLDGRQLYAWNTNTDRVEIYDTTNWTKIGELDPGVLINTQGNGSAFGRMQVVDDGRLLLMTTTGGVRVLDLNARLMTRITGTAGSDTLTGSVGGDSLFGLGGNDNLVGGEGDDILVGAAGADAMTGGSGSDTFRYLATSDSTAAVQDTITDFVTGTDRIDLTALNPTSVSVGRLAGGVSVVFAETPGGAFQAYVNGAVNSND